MKSGFTAILRGANFISMLVAGSAMAQDDAAKAVEEIVVTGTFIRGIAPESSQTISVDSAAIQAAGVTSTVDLLQTVPQLSDFQNLDGVSLTANINNALDEEPSTYQGIYNVTSDGYANGGTVGRLYQLGLRVSF